MSLYKHPTLRIAPWLSSSEEDHKLDQINELLLDEENEKLKTSGLVTFPRAYYFVINNYEGYDETDMVRYWTEEFYDKFPNDASAKIHYCYTLIDDTLSLKGCTQIETILKEEIDLLYIIKHTIIVIMMMSIAN